MMTMIPCSMMATKRAGTTATALAFRCCRPAPTMARPVLVCKVRPQSTQREPREEQPLAVEITNKMAPQSQIRQNFTSEVEAAINKQVNIELYASYAYLSMSYYFDRDDVALHNIAKWMKKQSDEEREHAMGFMKYQNTRGGRVVLQDIKKPEKDEWGSALEAFESALAIERYNNQSLLDLHRVASEANDVTMCDFLENKYLAEQVESIEEIGKIITNLRRVGKGLGEYMFDKEFQS